MEPKPLSLDFDWDWLIILDACRYDYFAKLWTHSEVEPRLSPGSCTLDFLGWLPRIESSVVITGHPFILLFRDKFTKVIDAGFDNKLNTCPPWYITSALNRTYHYVRSFKHKVLWFLQPHHPHIGEPKLNAGIYSDVAARELTPQELTTLMFKRAKEDGFLSQSYESNLRLVLEEVERILPSLKGKVVITSDHGEGLGEPLRPSDKPVFSHPCGLEEWEVRLVPFTTLKCGR